MKINWLRVPTATNLYKELRVFKWNSNNHKIKEKQPKMNKARFYIEGLHGKKHYTFYRSSIIPQLNVVLHNFLIQVFSWIISHQAPDDSISATSNFSKIREEDVRNVRCNPGFNDIGGANGKVERLGEDDSWNLKSMTLSLSMFSFSRFTVHKKMLNLKKNRIKKTDWRQLKPTINFLLLYAGPKNKEPQGVCRSLNNITSIRLIGLINISYTLQYSTYLRYYTVGYKNNNSGTPNC